MESEPRARGWRPAAHVRAALTDEGGVLLDLRAGRYVALNVVGAMLWRTLADGGSPDDAARSVARDFGQPVERVSGDVDAFVERLIADGLVSADDDKARRVPADAAPAAAPGVGVTDGEPTPVAHAWLVPCWWVVLAVALARRLLGFARLHALLHRLPRHGRRRDVPAARALSAAVDRAARFQPGRAECLERSAAALSLLRLRGWPAEMVIGVQPRPFVAHAWVELEGHVLNDRADVRARYLALERC